MPFPLPLLVWNNFITVISKTQPLVLRITYTTDATYNFLITSNETTLFIMGSAGLLSVPEGMTADVLILSVGGLDLLSRPYCDRLLSQTVDALDPKPSGSVIGTISPVPWITFLLAEKSWRTVIISLPQSFRV